MTARSGASFTTFSAFVMSLCFIATLQKTQFEVCHQCEETLQNDTVVGHFCVSYSGIVDGRCCLRDQNDYEIATIIGLDLSNCSLRSVEDLHEAYSASVIDLSNNPITNMSDAVFQGFTTLRFLRLPLTLQCPGGNASWEKVECSGMVCLCEEQKDSCHQAGNISWDCPENSLCAPNGPGFFQCSCVDSYHGYKCLRKGVFPVAEVFGVLGVSTVLVSMVLWTTQRRKLNP